MEQIWKTYRAEVRGIDPKTGEVDMFIPVSADSVDRDGEVVEPLAFKKTLPKFMKRPVLVSSHDYRDLTSQIGEWSKLKITDKGLEGKPKYYVGEGNDKADWGFKLASKGMAAFSIGFIPQKWTDGDGAKAPRRTYEEVELLEISQVIVPSNRDAIQSIRSKGIADAVTMKLMDEVEELIDNETGMEDEPATVDNLETVTKDLVTKPEVTENYVRIPVDTANHSEHQIRTIDISKDQGIKALYCATDKKIITYLFAKDKGWTMEKAKEWVKEHEKSIDEDIVNGTRTVTIEPHADIADEVDYLMALIDKDGLSDDAQDFIWDLMRKLLNISGNKIPADIKQTLAKMLEPEETILAIREIAKEQLNEKERKAEEDKEWRDLISEMTKEAIEKDQQMREQSDIDLLKKIIRRKVEI